MKHIFLSPHMDDAVFSAGNLLVTLKNKKKDILLITVFTAFGKRPISWDSQKHLITSGFIRLSSFGRARKKEDEDALNILGISYIHLDYIDGGFRKNKYNTILYPNAKALFSGTLHHDDAFLRSKLKKDLASFITPTDILYAPFGIGNHADHLIVRQVAESFPNTTYLWLDQPYALQQKKIALRGYKEAFRIPHKKAKERYIHCYASQVDECYPHGIPKNDEVFFQKK